MDEKNNNHIIIYFVIIDNCWWATIEKNKFDDEAQSDAKKDICTPPLAPQQSNGYYIYILK